MALELYFGQEIFFQILLLFLKRIKDFEKKYPDQQNVPRPPHWSGWRLLPEEVEFWLDGEGRVHERLNYKKKKW